MNSKEFTLSVPDTLCPLTHLAYLSTRKFSIMNQDVWQMTRRERETRQAARWSTPPTYTRAVARLMRLAITHQVVYTPSPFSISLNTHVRVHLNELPQSQ